ncbi:MAG: RNA-dependent DNA polymerase [Flavobacteriales bacterium]|nr:RNA-dependent DNA polymerase [Flavobacteriales bacterium]
MATTINKGKKQKDWFRLKRYPHVGLQLEPKDRAWIEPYLKDKTAISKHAFYPFIHRQLKIRKFRKEICHDGTRSKLRKPSTKEREIYFSNHLDSNVFSFYSEILSTAYENEIRDLGISSSIAAYRKIKLDSEKEKSRNKCNVDFAHDIFQFIKSNKEKDLVAITFDIKSFFDNLDHKLLKKYWKRIIKSGADLPEDHYNVFRNITKFSYIEEDDLFENFKNQIIVERKPKSFKEIKIKKKNYLRNKRAVAYCSKDNIEEIRNLGLIKSNKRVKDNKNYLLRAKGIPQGSPISATLANVYMLDFDKQAHDMLKNIGGVYQRYSDDMVAICPIEFEQEIIDHFLSSIINYKLEIQKSKTQVYHFKYDNKTERHYCFEKNLNTSRLQDNTLFEYLGFQFDGYHTLIKNSSISNYYRKMKRTFARSSFYTFHNKTATKGQVFKTRLYKKFTFVGAERRRIYQRHPSKSDVFILSHKYDWGNFITYAKLAEKTIIDNKIGGQLKRHWRKFHELMKKIERK